MRPFFPWLMTPLFVLPVLLTGCMASTSTRSIRPWEARGLEQELWEKAQLLCRYQLLRSPVLSRLPEHYRPSDIIRKEDLDYLRQHPEKAPRTELDKPGLHEALAHFTDCEVSASTWHTGTRNRADVFITEHRPRWEDASLRTPEVLSPRTPTERTIALVRWIRHHPIITRRHELSFQRTPEGWRANYQFPEQEYLRAHPVVVRQCPVVHEGPPVRPFGPGMTPPRLRSGNPPEYPRAAMEARVQGRFIARCILTREGEPRDCCILKDLPHVAEDLLRDLALMRFTPVLHQGQPIEVEYDFHFRFQLPR